MIKSNAMLILGLLMILVAMIGKWVGIEETKRQDKVYAESSAEQKLDMIYQQNKELKQMLEECRIWILAK